MKRLLILVTLFGSLLSHADLKDFYYHRYLDRKTPEQNVDSSDAVTTRDTFDQLVNPDDPSDQRTFKQRYFVNDSYAEGTDSPVLFYLCGEAACTEKDLRGAIRTHAEKHKAYLVALEHRYYGESQPLPLFTTENLKYLTTDNALKDAARFQRFFQQKRSLTGPWISIGGSYPGSLSAYYRLSHPELVVGALASSGPVQARDNFEEYDRHVALVAGPECLSDIKKVVAEVDAALPDADAFTSLKKKFLAEALVEPLDFVYLIADMGALAIQYGYRDRFCSLIHTDSPIDGYATFTKEIYSSWGINALSGSAQGALSLDPKSYPSVGNRQWFYQSCTEYGYWQNAYHDSKISARSPLINPAYHINLCKRLFGIDKPAEVSHINETFYKRLLDPKSTRVFFTNGSTDPWMNLSIAIALGNTTNPNHTYFTIDKAAHCDDLHPPRGGDSQAVKTARSMFSDLISEWTH